eukprot:2214957-Rhodomonas_salina.1
MALVAGIDETPVISWGSTASTLKESTLSRTVVHDGVLAAKAVRVFSEMGWTRVAILYVNDAWGRSARVPLAADP